MEECPHNFRLPAGHNPTLDERKSFFVPLLHLAEIAGHLQIVFDRWPGLGSPGLHVGILPVLGFLPELGEILGMFFDFLNGFR